MKWSMCLCVVAIIAGCKTADSSSQALGHFEEAESTDLTRYRKKVTAIPEYQPSQAVILSPLLFSSLPSAVGKSLVKGIIDADAEVWMASNDYEDADAAIDALALSSSYAGKVRKLPTTLLDTPGELVYWTRDYAPIGAKFNDELLLVDFNYASWSRQQNDAVPRHFSAELDTPRVSLPLYLEGGNFMVNDDGVCVMSEVVVTANSDAAVQGDIIFSKDEIITYMYDYVGCRRVIITPQLPQEGTGHIDLWLKFLDNRTVLIAELPQATVDALPPGSVKQVAAEMRDFLEEQADLFASDFTVKRVRVSAPVYGDGAFTLPSYTNSLLVNGTAFVPEYKIDSFDEKNAALDRAAQEVYSQHGFNVVPIGARAIYTKGGSIHCASMQIPKVTAETSTDPAPTQETGCYKILGSGVDGRYEGSTNRMCMSTVGQRVQFNFFRSTTASEDYIIEARPSPNAASCANCSAYENDELALKLKPQGNSELRLYVRYLDEDEEDAWEFHLRPE